MLAKQVWRILQAPESLVARLLKARYFPNNNILNSGPGYKSSFIWKSLLEGRDLLIKGVRSLIGKGDNTNIWLDPWLPEHPPRPPRRLAGTDNNLFKVSELMDDRSMRWDQNKLRQNIAPEDIPLILKIQISPTTSPDLLGWHYNDTGNYTVKSGYWLATHHPEYDNAVLPPPGQQGFKTAIWKMKTAPKIQHFLWRLLSNALPTGTILSHRGIPADTQCQRCQRADESIEHLFFDCDYVHTIWRRNRGLQRSNYNPTRSFSEKFRAVIDCYNNHSLTDYERHHPIWLLWRIWKSRNLLVYQHKDSNWQEDITKAESDTREWLDGQLENSGNVRSDPQARCSATTLSEWTRPRSGYVKCNYDCKFGTSDEISKAAWIMRDVNGFYINAGHSEGQNCSTVLEAELQALVIARQQTWARGYRHVIFEGDNYSAT